MSSVSTFLPSAVKVWEDVRKEQEAVLTFSADGKERLGPLGTTSRYRSAAFMDLHLQFLQLREAEVESAMCAGTGLC